MLLRDLTIVWNIERSDGDEHVALACFEYNTEIYETIGITPYRAIFGAHAIESR